MQGEEIYERKLTVDWAFQEKPLIERNKPK
jgi:hypothetical protein